MPAAGRCAAQLEFVGVPISCVVKKVRSSAVRRSKLRTPPEGGTTNLGQPSPTGSRAGLGEMDLTGNGRASAVCSEIWSAADHRRFGERLGRDSMRCGVSSGSTRTPKEVDERSVAHSERSNGRGRCQNQPRPSRWSGRAPVPKILHKRTRSSTRAGQNGDLFLGLLCSGSLNRVSRHLELAKCLN